MVIYIRFVLFHQGPNRGIIQTMLVLTAICCYLFWLAVYLFQMYPLIGPMVKTSTIKSMKWTWASNATQSQWFFSSRPFFMLSKAAGLSVILLLLFTYLTQSPRLRSGSQCPSIKSVTFISFGYAVVFAGLKYSYFVCCWFVLYCII